MYLKDLGDVLDVVSLDLEELRQAFGGECSNTGPLRTSQLFGDVISFALGRTKHEGPCEQVALHRELLADDDEC